MALVVSPITFRVVAGASINIPIVDIRGNVDAGKLYRLTISISPMSPPPGMPDITTPDNTDTTKAIR